MIIEHNREKLDDYNYKYEHHLNSGMSHAESDFKTYFLEICHLFFSHFRLTMHVWWWFVACVYFTHAHSLNYEKVTLNDLYKQVLENNKAHKRGGELFGQYSDI